MIPKSDLRIHWFISRIVSIASLIIFFADGFAWIFQLSGNPFDIIAIILCVAGVCSCVGCFANRKEYTKKEFFYSLFMCVDSILIFIITDTSDELSAAKLIVSIITLICVVVYYIRYKNIFFKENNLTDNIVKNKNFRIRKK